MFNQHVSNILENLILSSQTLLGAFDSHGRPHEVEASVEIDEFSLRVAASSDLIVDCGYIGCSSSSVFRLSFRAVSPPEFWHERTALELV